MTDVETRLRETLVRHANRVEVAEVTPVLLRRARRLLARTVAASVVSVLALTGIGMWSVRSATAEPVRPAHQPLVPKVAAHNGDLAYVVGPPAPARIVIRHRDGTTSTLTERALETTTCTREPARAEAKDVPRCGGFSDLVWAPHGRWLAFLFWHPWLQPDTARASVYVVRADGTGLHRIGACPTHHGIEPCDTIDGVGPAWSPDGSRIAVSGNGRIWVASVGKGGFRELTRCPPCVDSHPAWSPDGRSIAFARDDGVYEVSVADGSTWRLAPVQGTKAPVWSPDGTRIAIYAEDGVYVLDGVDGSGSVHRIAAIQSPRRISAPAWSPDGRRLAWVADASSRVVWRAPHADLWVTSLSGDAPVRIRQGPCCLAEGFPPLGVAWSPDGRELAMHAPGETLTRKLQGVLLVDASSGRFRRIPGGFAAWPAWQPVG